MFVEACQTQYFRYNILGYSDISDMSCWWLERLCSSAGLAPPKPGYKQQQQREESAADGRWGGKSRLSWWWRAGEGRMGCKRPFHSRQHMLAPEHQSNTCWHQSKLSGSKYASKSSQHHNSTSILVHQWHRLTLYILLLGVLFRCYFEGAHYPINWPWHSAKNFFPRVLLLDHLKTTGKLLFGNA